MRHAHKDVPIGQIKSNPRNARTHSKKQIQQIAESIRAFGFTTPILLDENNMLLAGHARLESAKLVGLPSIPAIVVTGLSDAQKRTLLLADNRLALSAGWDRAQLAVELTSLPDLLAEIGLDSSITGFEPAEIDALLIDLEDGVTDPVDEYEATILQAPPVTQPGDLWGLGKNRLLCGDARSTDDLKILMAGELAHAAFLDPPYNVKASSIGGRGAIRHRNFRMASGEMSREMYISFLTATLESAARFSSDGAVHFICIDWRHVEELVTAGRAVYGQMINLIAWIKSNAGQGSFYRSQHELIGVFRAGTAPHLNTIELGRHGRNRSNVWHYAGANTFRAGRLEDLRAHPTVKPVAMIADAIKDCTRRDQVVLDTFCGSGATLLAAERVGRRGYGLEIDPEFVNVAVRRWQSFTGKDAIHLASGISFEEVGQNRRTEGKTRQLTIPRGGK